MKMEDDVSAEKLFFLLKKISLTPDASAGRTYEKQGI